MRYKKLGRTGMKISAFCLGTMTFGDQADEAESIKITDAAIRAGVNFIDCADRYQDGKSETILGKALKNKRHNIVLATKVCQRMSPDVNDIGFITFESEDVIRHNLVRKIVNAYEKNSK